MDNKSKTTENDVITPGYSLEDELVETLERLLEIITEDFDEEARMEIIPGGAIEHAEKLLEYMYNKRNKENPNE